MIPTGTYGIAMTVANSNLTVGYKSFQQATTGSGTTRTITPLFPYASGYQVWAGDCADADPAAYTGGSRGAVLASNQGATTSGSAAMDAVDVTVRRTSVTSTLQSGATVSAIHAAGTGCTAGETLTTTTTTNSSDPEVVPILPLPTTNTAIKAETDRAAGKTGCLYNGPTRIVLNAGGTMTVTSPFTTASAYASCVGCPRARRRPAPAARTGSATRSRAT